MAGLAYGYYQNCLDEWKNTSHTIFEDMLRTTPAPWTEDFTEFLSESMGVDDRLLLHAQSILVHAANVSKILWPSPVKEKNQNAINQSRGNTLRSELDLAGNLAIQKRTLRNHLEHYDERVLNWKPKANKSYFDAYQVTSIRSYDAPGFAPERLIDPVTGAFTFQGERFDLNEIQDELKALRSSVERWIEADAAQPKY